MKTQFYSGLLITLICTNALAADGLIRIQSDYSVQKTAQRFEQIAQSKGITIFAKIDHKKNAEKVNMSLNPTQVIIFGNPKVGTPLMQCQQSVAIDLPQKVLITEDENKVVSISYNDPAHTQKRHHIKGCEAALKKMSGALNKLSTTAAQKP